jgi:hypothetical protein
MPGVWIDKVYNNSKATWKLSSVDDQNNGALFQGGKKVVELDGGEPHDIAPGQYDAQSCGVPWYNDGSHYKLATKGGPGLSFFMAQQDGKNWVLFRNFQTGSSIARIEVSMVSDSRVYLRFENDGVYLDVIDAPSSSGAVQTVDTVGKWVDVAKSAAGIALMLL